MSEQDLIHDGQQVTIEIIPRRVGSGRDSIEGVGAVILRFDLRPVCGTRLNDRSQARLRWVIVLFQMSMECRGEPVRRSVFPRCTEPILIWN